MNYYLILYKDYPINICLGKSKEFIYFVISAEYELKEVLNNMSKEFIKKTILKYLDYKLVEDEEIKFILRIDIPNQ